MHDLIFLKVSVQRCTWNKLRLFWSSFSLYLFSLKLRTHCAVCYNTVRTRMSGPSLLSKRFCTVASRHFASKQDCALGRESTDILRQRETNVFINRARSAGTCIIRIYGEGIIENILQKTCHFVKVLVRYSFKWTATETFRFFMSAEEWVIVTSRQVEGKERNDSKEGPR